MPTTPCCVDAEARDGRSAAGLAPRLLVVAAGVAAAAVGLAVREAGARHSRQQPALEAEQDAALVRYLAAEVPPLMERLAIPGAVVVVVRGTRVVTNAGFGLADVERRTAVDPERTVFRTASVAKVFTAVAALQLVGAGRLGLTEDLSRFVPDVALGDAALGALTLHRLLTHTAGFDERLIGYLNAPDTPPIPLGEYLAREMPGRHRTADDVPGYSNHGYALVGLVVERIAGQPFADRCRTRVFEPLGMRDTRFLLQPGDASADLVTYANIAFYSQSPLPPQVGTLASAAERIVAASQLYEPAFGQRVFVVERPWLWALLNGPHRRAMARNVELGNAILIPRLSADAGEVLHFDGRRAGAVGILGHEMVHTLEQRRIGLVSVWRLEWWQREGYPEYVASGKGRLSEAPPGYRDASAAWKRLLEQEGCTFDEIVRAPSSLESVMSRPACSHRDDHQE